MINGTYEEGVKDCLKFLKDNSKIDFEMPLDQFISLLGELSERGVK